LSIAVTPRAVALVARGLDPPLVVLVLGRKLVFLVMMRTRAFSMHACIETSWARHSIDWFDEPLIKASFQEHTYMQIC
jgi:hypothetical protein